MNADGLPAWDRVAIAVVWRALAVLAIGCCGAAPVGAEDLLGAYERARRHDPVLQAALHAHDAARERVPQARAGLLPTVGLVGNAGGQSGASSFDRSAPVDRTVRSRSWSLQLSQPLWRPANRLAYAQAQAQEVVADEQWRQAQQDSMLRLTQAYFDALVAEESLRVARGQEAAVQRQLDLASGGHAAGTATVTDVHEALARRDLAQSQALAAQAEVELRFGELERQLGASTASLATLPDPASEGDLPPPAEDAETWMERARAQHPAVRLQEATLAAAEAEIARSQAAHGPTLDLVANYGRHAASGSMASPADVSSRVNATQVGLNLQMPLFAGGSVAARVRESLALRDRAQDELETARRQVAAQARQAWNGVHYGRLQLRALASAVASSRSAVEDNRIGYRIGTRINIDVLNAEQQLYAARRDWFKARVEVLMHALRLKASAGLLEESDLATVNRLLVAPI
ncbi:TolC family outer membrane protein [Xylophilus sp. GOD-11R]|uniref:TolC family outer membrane protein n=1 Tax=Xylophilus sp. GOD-11R TaxID=3089814 RepID=UPI00298BE903|nr:TolC family outer membrane protein [Xylophilus sp. GOD-11R]WPB56476.1 TolC family outer membrane protein [Xylophilus sp. GOD-11R]